MPQGTRVHRCVKYLKHKHGYGKSIGICQKSTKQSYMTGKTIRRRKKKKKTQKGGGWCTAKKAKRHKTRKKCLKKGCVWARKQCTKISTYARSRKEDKKTKCGKYYKGKWNVDAKGCKKDKRCRYSDMGSGGEWCLLKK